MLTDAMECGLVIRASGECPEVDVSRALVGEGRDAHLAEKMQAVRRDGHSDLMKVVGPETRQLRIAKVFGSSKIFGFVFYSKASEYAWPEQWAEQQSSLLVSWRRRTRDRFSSCSTCLNTLMDSSLGSWGSPSFTVSTVA